MNDKMPPAEFEQFLIDAGKSIYAVLKDGGSFYIFTKNWALAFLLMRFQQLV